MMLKEGQSGMKKHDLFNFFKQANKKIESEYLRICESVEEDPGTAGDQGEENWKEILEKWLPNYFHVETKGRILYENGETSPQVDIVVLSPEYPPELWKKKRYLSSGVVAAFECKTTLRREHLKTFLENSKKIRNLEAKMSGTPRKDLHGYVYYGLLAHSHNWNKEKSRPQSNIRNAIYGYDRQIISCPREMPDIICVANLAVWETVRLVIPKQKGVKNPLVDHNSIRAVYSESKSNSDLYTPVGAMIFDLLDYLAWEYPGLRSFVSFMRNLDIKGKEEGLLREWGMDVLSSETLDKLDTGKNMLTNGSFWDEWNMVQ